MRSLQMQAKKARHACLSRRNPQCDDMGGGLGRVGDQRRQHACGAKRPVRRADAAQTVHIGRAVQHQPAAAVHLQIQKCGGKDTGYGPAPLGRCLGFGQDGGDPVRLDHQGVAVKETRAVNYPGAGQNLGHHTVSVTLRRCGGVSGSKPRRRANPSIKA